MADTTVPQRLDFAPGDIVGGRYTIDKSLGQGSFGQVYKVTAPQGNRLALKLLRLWDVPSSIRQPLVDRFEMEYQTGRIASDYLVHSIDHGFASGNPYIIMEFCPGGDLTAMVGHPEGPVSKVASDILHGLHDLHINGKVHRDLKPENVLFRADRTAVLTDFGIAGDRNKRMTERNIFGKPYQMFGTYAYMPPEQVNRARGEATVLPTTDIFSFGVVIYQLLTGQLPFGQLETPNDLVRYQKRGKAGEWDQTPLQHIAGGKAWVKLIGGCLEPDYKRRLQTARAAMHLLPEPQPSRTAQAQALAHPAQEEGVRQPSTNATLYPSLSLSRFEQKHPRGALLRVMHGDDYGRTYDLSAMVQAIGRRALTLGRATTSDVCIAERQSAYVSRRHCTLETDPQALQWCIRDGQWDATTSTWLRSSNGTYVGSSEISDRGFWLVPGDIVSVGDTKLRFELYA